MTYADWFILAVLLFSGILSWFRGFLSEALSLVSWGAAFVVTSKFYERLAYKLTWFDNEGMRKILACVILFVLTLLVLGLCSNIIRSLVHKVGFSAIDRLLGMVFGLIRGTLILCLMLVFLHFGFQARILSFMEDEPFYRDSLFIPELERIVAWFFDYTKQNNYALDNILESNKTQDTNVIYYSQAQAKDSFYQDKVDNIVNTSNAYLQDLKDVGQKVNSAINNSIDENVSKFSAQAGDKLEHYVNNTIQTNKDKIINQVQDVYKPLEQKYKQSVDEFEDALLDGTQGTIDLDKLN